MPSGTSLYFGFCFSGYLGSLASALFTALSVQGAPLELWGCRLLEAIPLALKHGNPISLSSSLSYRYLLERGLSQGSGPAAFPSAYGAAERDVEYNKWSLDGWAGRSGHDAPMIAYDALLGAGDSWEELCSRSMFHGDNSVLPSNSIVHETS
ncbi:protein ADP-ribosylarginine hydrolase-like protein 1 [Xenopus laevis]|uniref:Protein ADP-ribosylarginine hydrolase-like protein 1 n=1 Tax=Xenopus laevis TaxID=8355 RepID=A0A8J0U3I6_XENLA|nr:protein ADP-ribosylarginine hydrolase-like protein 1 [Xenopus laevis]